MCVYICMYTHKPIERKERKHRLQFIYVRRVLVEKIITQKRMIFFFSPVAINSKLRGQDLGIRVKSSSSSFSSSSSSPQTYQHVLHTY